MKTLLIGYDLNKAGQNYDDLIKTIKEIAGTWLHNLDSTWLITSNLSCSEVRAKLGKHIDANDELMVLDVTHDDWATRGFSAVANKWLEDNV